MRLPDWGVREAISDARAVRYGRRTTVGSDNVKRAGCPPATVPAAPGMETPTGTAWRQRTGQGEAWENRNGARRSPKRGKRNEPDLPVSGRGDALPARARRGCASRAQGRRTGEKCARMAGRAGPHHPARPSTAGAQPELPAAGATDGGRQRVDGGRNAAHSRSRPHDCPQPCSSESTSSSTRTERRSRGARGPPRSQPCGSRRRCRG